MTTMRPLLAALCVCALAAAAVPTLAGPPDPTTSSCSITVAQMPGSPPCLGAVPVITRLCPLGDYDTVRWDLVIRDAAGVVCPGVTCSLFELPTTTQVNMVGGGPTAITNAAGQAQLSLSQCSGYGYITVCADGVVLPCRIEVRSPDCAFGPTPATCPLPTGVNSFVNVNDRTNLLCGFTANFGPVVPANQWWDLNCNGFVNASDVQGYGIPPAGGWKQHVTHNNFLRFRNTCP